MNNTKMSLGGRKSTDDDFPPAEASRMQFQLQSY